MRLTAALCSEDSDVLDSAVEGVPVATDSRHRHAARRANALRIERIRLSFLTIAGIYIKTPRAFSPNRRDSQSIAPRDTSKNHFTIATHANSMRVARHGGGHGICRGEGIFAFSNVTILH